MGVNRQIILGIIIAVSGLFLLIYSIFSYSEVKLLSDKIDFEELDNNKQVPTSEKYYKYLAISDFLNQKLKQNKNLPLKNISCVYVDYAQHNTVSLFNLIYKGNQEDSSKRGVVEGNVKFLDDMLGNYKMCKNSPIYKQELDGILDQIEKINSLRINDRTLYEESENGLKNFETEDSDGILNLNDEDISDDAPLIEKVGN